MNGILILFEAAAGALRDLCQNPRHLGADPALWRKQWRINCKHVGRGKTALRYASAYVAKTAFTEQRLAGYDEQGRIRLRCKNSDTDQWETIRLKPVEFIRRWLIHVLPKGFVRVRHYGWLSPAAHKALRRVRHLLGLGPPRPVPKTSFCPRSFARTATAIWDPRL